MDLRAPLHDDTGGDGTSSKLFNNEGTAPWWVNNSSASSAIDPRLYEKIVCSHLCRMYVASEAMDLGIESRFTGLVLFHRYVRHLYRSVQRQRHQQNKHLKQTSREAMKQISLHLGTVAAACLLLGCKMEEEPRRIRDVINLSHILKFSMGDSDENAVVSSTSASMDNLDAQNKNTLSEPVTIIELPQPPPLDDSYWSVKEQIVSAEQHVLRMIQFDTTVCHPHRCVLIIMEILGFGTGRKSSNERSGEVERESWLLNPEQSDGVIRRAWMMLNDAPLDGKGVALQYPVIVLSCAAISLAAEATNNNNSNSKIIDGGIVPLPGFWWTALGVTTEEIIMAKDALQKRTEGST